MDTGAELKQALGKSAMLKGIQQASESAISYAALMEKDRANMMAEEEAEEDEAPVPVETPGEDDGIQAENLDDDEGQGGADGDGFEDSIFVPASAVPEPGVPPKRLRTESARPAGNPAIPRREAPALSNPLASHSGRSPAAGHQPELGPAKKKTGAGLSAKEQSVLDKAEESLNKMADVFGPEKMWEGKVRSRQVEAMARAASSSSSKLCSISEEKCPQAHDLSNKLMVAVSDMEARHDAITHIRADARQSVESLDKHKVDAILTCDLSVLSSMLVKTGADLVKLMDTQDVLESVVCRDMT